MKNPQPFSLSRQQRNFFDTFGYLLLPGALKDEIAGVSNLFDELHEKDKEQVLNQLHEAHYMKSRWILLQFIERTAESARLLDHPVINGVFTALLGDDFLYRGSDANIFTGDTYWHSDLYGAFFKYRHVKVLLYLEPLDEKNGAIRVIPGSHQFGDKFADLCDQYVWKHEAKLDLPKEQVPSVVIRTQPGDALFFDYRLKHATCNSQDNRRMLSIGASQRFQPEHLAKLAELTSMYLPFTGGQAYRPDFVATATASQHKHIDQVLEAFQLIQAGNAGNPVA